MVELIPRSRLTKTLETTPAALGADPDARVRIPKFGLTSHLDQGSVEVVCEITWDGVVWSELGRDVFTPESKARDGSPASVAYALTVWGEDDKPRSPLASRYRLIPTGGPTLEAAVTERRDPTAKPQVRHHSIALVQSAEKVGSVSETSTELAYGSNITANNLLCNGCTALDVSGLGVTIQTPTDTRSSSYAAMAAQQSLFGVIGLRNFYAVAPSSGACTVTFSQTNSGFFTVVISEFSGAATTTPLDGGTGTTGTGTAASPGNVTPSEDNCLIFATMTHGGTDRTITEEAGWSLVQEHEGGSTSGPISVIYKVQTTATTEDADWTIGTGSVDWAATCGVFKAAAAAGASGSGAFTQPMQVLSGTGKKAYPGTGALVQPMQQVAGTGVMLPDGSGTLIQPVQLLSGTGKQVIPGVGAFTVPVQVLTGSGIKGYPGIGAFTVPVQLLSGTGKQVLAGTGTLTLPAQVLAGTGKQTLAGAGAFVLPMQLLAGTGAAGGLSGTGALTQPMQLLAGSGVVIPVGTGAFIIPAQALSGTGKQALAGSGAFILPAQVLTGTGAAGGVVGIGALMQPFQALTGSGKQVIPGVGAIAVPVQVLTGSGKQVLAGAGALTQPMQALAGSGVKGYPGTGSFAVPVQVLTGTGLIVPFGVVLTPAPIPMTGSYSPSFDMMGSYSPSPVLRGSGLATMTGSVGD